MGTLQALQIALIAYLNPCAETPEWQYCGALPTPYVAAIPHRGQDEDRPEVETAEVSRPERPDRPDRPEPPRCD